MTSIYKISQKKPVKMSWNEEDNGGMVRFEVGGIIKNARLLNADVVDVKEMPYIVEQMKAKTEEYNLGVYCCRCSGLLQMCFEGETHYAFRQSRQFVQMTLKTMLKSLKVRR